MKVTISEEGVLLRFSITTKLPPELIVRDISNNMKTPEWCADLLGVRLLSYSASESANTISFVFVMPSWGKDTAKKEKTVIELIEDSVDFVTNRSAKEIDAAKYGRVDPSVKDKKPHKGARIFRRSGKQNVSSKSKADYAGTKLKLR